MNRRTFMHKKVSAYRIPTWAPYRGSQACTRNRGIKWGRYAHTHRCTYTQMHVHATCMSTDNLHSVTVQRRCPDHRTCPAREVSTYLRHTNRYGWHISLKRKFTQISRHLFETHIFPLVTVKVVVAVHQHAKQTRS